jgi:anti-sigma regulatory factor (Ser/Thr protein kinase)
MGSERSRPDSDELSLSPDLQAPGRARAWLGQIAQGRLSAERLADAHLLLSELVSNSVEHAGGGAITVRARVADGHVRVEVWDLGPGLPPGPYEMPRPDPARGRGLPLIARVADRWGAPRTTQACVWFELDEPADACPRRA